MQISVRLSGPRDRIAAELTEEASDAPETEIRAAIAAYITRRLNAEDQVSVSFSLSIQGD